MRHKRRERALANRAQSKESNKPKTTSAERMRKLRERRKAETSDVASEPGVASTSRAAQAMDIDTDSEQSTQSQTESTQYSTWSLCNSHNLTFVIHSSCYLCNKCILIHKTFNFFSLFYTHLNVFTQKIFGSISKILPTPFFSRILVKINLFNHVGFMVDKVALGQAFSEYFGFPCQSAFHQFLHNHPRLLSGAGTIGQ
jgi:hypothetical protein